MRFLRKRENRKLTLREKQLLNYFLRDWYFQFYHESFQTEPGYESNLRPHKSVRLAVKIILHSVSFQLALSIIPFGWIPFEGCNNVNPENVWESSGLWSGCLYSTRKLFLRYFPCSWTTNTDSHLHTSCGNELGLSLETCEKHGQLTLSSLQHLRRYRGHKFDTFLLCNGH